MPAVTNGQVWNKCVRQTMQRRENYNYFLRIYLIFKFKFSIFLSILNFEMSRMTWEGKINYLRQTRRMSLDTFMIKIFREIVEPLADHL